ncbi:MAG TPA: Fe(2+)-trafficking protein [Phycisphaerae bacterium]|nr:Fe(2+)-trafficking protein [Phycisphaerae bacterium]HOJ73556.1 Fe(2+)-trafficking protein [Phycisphaerae bacterium]HOM51636.1 Fe(2+)-trafficking protein [Phycisphaerae bacterium]HON65402.1 Fe(2+)-trafficking protein [Phycisphaerae bacterium]HOQ85370.1 Fe(2+)-trafficking protein [Phycisphaerae bacterium]
MADDPRIQQFKKMTEADPDNELGHFSLGKIYLEVGEYSQAVDSLRRAVELAPTNSRAYYLLALAQKGAGQRDAAIETLRKGYDVANERGDLMPRKDMVALMKTLGVEPPAEEAPAASTSAAAASAASTPAAGEAGQTITCRRCGQTKPKMAERPFKGPLGERVWAEVCQTCWQEWIPMGTKVINEFRLNFADPRSAEVYDQYMKEFLNLD